MIITPSGVPAAVERRTAPMTGMMPLGYGWTDPAAIPPPNMGSMSVAGVPITAYTALQVDSVFTALRVLSNAIIKMGNPRAYVLDYDHDNNPYAAWIKQQPSILTNTWGNCFQFDGMARTVCSLGLFGEAFWYTLTRDYLQRPSALEVLNPAIIVPDKDHPGDWLYGTGSDRKRLSGEDVTHIPFLALPGMQRGLSALDYANVSLALALAAMEYGQRWFSQGASPSYLLSTDQKLGEPEVRRIAERFIVDHAGLENAHLPLVLDMGMKAQKIQSTPDEAQYLQTLEYARQCIASWFGLPSHLVGGSTDTGNVWGRTVEEQGLQMQDYTLSGYTTRLNEAFSSLLPRGTFAKLDETMITRSDSMSFARELQWLRTGGVMTPNEVRTQKLGLRPLPGGDELLTPLNTNTNPMAGGVFEGMAEENDPSLDVPDDTTTTGDGAFAGGGDGTE